MSLILNIDTSTQHAGISLAENGVVLKAYTNTHQKDHASFLHVAIQNIFREQALELKSLDAVAVINGPGSYTGLRVGMASAKGLCFALDKPFITIGSLNALARSAIDTEKDLNDTTLFCPMVDARRMEVFTALFDKNMNEILGPVAMILDERSFEERLKIRNICFFGDGCRKFEQILLNSNAVFTHFLDTTTSMASLSFEKYMKKKFTHLVDSEPLYIKDFHISPDFHNKKQAPL